MKEFFIGLFILLFIISSNVATWHAAKDKYRNEGKQDYHHICYFRGPMILLDEETNVAVRCRPLTQLPPMEGN